MPVSKMLIHNLHLTQFAQCPKGYICLLIGLSRTKKSFGKHVLTDEEKIAMHNVLLEKRKFLIVLSNSKRQSI